MTQKAEDPLSTISELDGVNKLIHEPARLKILAVLAIVNSADFIYIMHHTNLTWGNMSTHLKKLEEAKFVKVTKDFVDRKPHTFVELTETGREAFNEYRSIIETFFANL